jgi:hypothetical protein
MRFAMMRAGKSRRPAEIFCALEAVTQDNLPPESKQAPPDKGVTAERPRGALIVVGHRFKNRIHRRCRSAAPMPGHRVPIFDFG